MQSQYTVHHKHTHQDSNFHLHLQHSYTTH
jgi:hypothetical protein